MFALCFVVLFSANGRMALPSLEMGKAVGRESFRGGIGVQYGTYRI